MTGSLLVSIVLCVALMFSTCEEERRRPTKYLIPEGYVGWVRTEFKVKDAPALAIEDGYYLQKFPPSGLLRTSSDIEYGWAIDEFYYYSGNRQQKLKSTGWGEGGMIWAGTVEQSDINGEKKVTKEFFVGTEKELKEWGFDAEDEHGSTKIGSKELIKPD